MNSATAALIAAGTSSVVNVIALYGAHRLTLRRERRAFRRQRVGEVVHRAALALHLYGDGAGRDVARSESPRPFADQHPEETAVLQRGSPMFTELSVVLGDGHRLAMSYFDAVRETAEMEVAMRNYMFLMGEAVTPDMSEAEVRDVVAADQELVDEVASLVLSARDVRMRWTEEAEKFVASI